MTAAMLAQAGSSVLGGLAAGGAQRSAANKAYAAQKESLIKMQEMLESIGIPSIEAQKIALESPEYAGDLIVENLGPSALEEIQTDTRLADAQMNALRDLQQIGEVGLTPEERAQRAEMLREGAAQNQAQQQQILQSMAQRGNLDSGASLIAQLQSNAQQGMDARRQSEQMAADVASRRRDAIMRAASMAGGMEQQDFSRQAQQASAADRIAQFNLQNRMRGQERNLDARQQQAVNESNISNRQQEYNKGLIGQDYQNRLQRAQGMMGIQGQMGQAQANRALQQGQASAQQATGIASGIGNAATAFGSYAQKNPGAFGGSSSSNYDNMNFGDAFNKAYSDKGAGETFNWQGKDYLLKRK
jgi:NADH dehydrogenase/NADH:ubiquinone oxidoreductase subunit G